MSWTISLAISTVLLSALCTGLYLCNRDLGDAFHREEQTCTRLLAERKEAWDNSRKWQDLYCKATNDIASRDRQLQAVRDALDTPPPAS